jgi:hypothetical protein
MVRLSEDRAEERVSLTEEKRGGTAEAAAATMMQPARREPLSDRQGGGKEGKAILVVPSVKTRQPELALTGPPGLLSYLSVSYYRVQLFSHWHAQTASSSRAAAARARICLATAASRAAPLSCAAWLHRS